MRKWTFPETKANPNEKGRTQFGMFYRNGRQRPSTGQLFWRTASYAFRRLGSTKKLRQSEMLFFFVPRFIFCQKLCPHDMEDSVYEKFLLFVSFHFFWGANGPKKLCMVKTNKTFRHFAQKNL